ncbi:MAG: alkaline phosphatase D family protein [Planctomycetota bacterium]
MDSLSRRFALKLLATGSACLGALRATRLVGQQTTTDEAPVEGLESSGHQSIWSKTVDRVFLGGDYWANPMEDWRVIDGAAECIKIGGDRNIQLLTHQLTDPTKSFEMSVTISEVEVRRKNQGVGFRLGVRSDINEYRSNLFAKGGLAIGVRGGELVIGRRSLAIDGVDNPKDLTLKLSGSGNGDQVALTLIAIGADGKTLGKLHHSVAAQSVVGNVALVNNFPVKPEQNAGARYRFSDWRVDGDAFTVNLDQRFGPILWSMYSLSDSRGPEGFVMKITALTGPLGADDNQEVQLQVQRDGQWQSLGNASLDTDAWTATFRIPNWDESAETPYQLIYQENHSDGSTTPCVWSGKIKANPVGRPLRMGAMTCQNDYAFPYEPVANNVVKLDPDLIYFSGDQLYEGHGGYGLIREPAEPAILNYLRKYYQFGMAFREAMRDRPTICLADDHDVFQGNIWGEGGKPMDIEAGGTSSNGGYREPARMVNVVHRTNTSHHPDVYDPTPVLQDISVYYGDMVYGNVSFAILADRQWKSGPQNVDTGSGRADHLKDPDIDPKGLDKPGLVLLGRRQEAFLEQWVNDWRGHEMKVVLSQTVFAGMATHHGGYDGYLVADLDSGGWPQTPRDRAVKIITKGRPLHINGDQHLTSLVQYGVDKQRDGCWSFCTPAIAVGYPRWWRADEMKMPYQNRPQHGLPNTGEYLDGLGNKVYVYAVGNPEVATKKNRYERAHQKASGFGYVVIDTEAKTYELNSYRFLVDPTDGNPENQFPGWPVTIHQQENGGENRLR